MKKLIIINGFPEAGKDTFIDLTLCWLKERFNKQAEKFSSIDLVKEAATILGWDGVKDEQGRDFLSELKDLSSTYYDGPFKYIKKKVTEGSSIFYFICIREPEEIAKIKAYFDGSITVLIRGTYEKIGLTNTGDSGVLNFEYDLTVYNNGTLEELDTKAKTFAESLVLSLTQ
jgi:hypothetical protein